MRISDWSSDVCSSDLRQGLPLRPRPVHGLGRRQEHRRQERSPGGERMTVTTSAPSGGGEAAVPPEDLVTLTLDGLEISVPKDRKRVVWGMSVSVRVDLGGSRVIKKKIKDTIRL